MPAVSVVLCTLNEAPTLPALLADLQQQSLDHEVICVDGGSRDNTAALAAAARGEVLLFLHADSRFPSDGLAALWAALMRRPECVGGNFRLLFDGQDAFSRWLTGFYARIRAHGLYYGDSGIFVRREIYQALGGLRPISLMEDYDFVRRMERRGPTVCIASPALVTSSRRFHGRPAAAIVCGWLWMHALFMLGASPAWLARLYRSARHERPGPAAQPLPASFNDQS